MPMEAMALLSTASGQDLTQVLADQREGRKARRQEAQEAKDNRGRGRGQGRGRGRAKKEQPEQAPDEAEAAKPCQDGQQEPAPPAMAKRACEEPGNNEEKPKKVAKKVQLSQDWATDASRA